MTDRLRPSSRKARAILDQLLRHSAASAKYDVRTPSAPQPVATAEERQEMGQWFVNALRRVQTGQIVIPFVQSDGK